MPQSSRCYCNLQDIYLSLYLFLDMVWLLNPIKGGEHMVRGSCERHQIENLGQVPMMSLC